MRLVELTGLGIEVEPGHLDEALRLRALTVLRGQAADYLRACGRFERDDWLDFTGVERVVALDAAAAVRAEVLGGLLGGAAPDPAEAPDDLDGFEQRLRAAGVLA